MVALNKETAKLDEAIVAAVKTGRTTAPGVKARLAASDDFQLRTTTERKIAKRLEALRRAGILKCNNSHYAAADSAKGA